MSPILMLVAMTASIAQACSPGNLVFQSAETLYRDGARYPEYVEIASKGHAMEAVEVIT